MIGLFRLLMLLFAMETAPAEPEEGTDDQGGEEEESEAVEGADEEEEAEAEEEIRDPAAKLKTERSKWQRLSLKLTKTEEELAEARKELEGGKAATALRDSRVQAAFLRAVLDRGERLDLETTWDLATIRGFLDTVDVNDDGDVEGMEDALGRCSIAIPGCGKSHPSVKSALRPGRGSGQRRPPRSAGMQQPPSTRTRR